MEYNNFALYINEEQRQSVNLSTYSWNVIKSDMSIFLSAYEESQNFSHFANIIINNYLLNSPVALTQYAAKKFEKYSMLADDISDDVKNKLLSLAVGSHAAGLLSYPKGESKKIRISNDNMKLLSQFSENTWEYKIFKKPGKLLKALFETYALLPYYKRESVFFNEKIEAINDAIGLGKKIKVTTDSNLSYLVIPYTIKADSLSNYNYLIGLSFENSAFNLQPTTIASFRISKLKDIQRIKESFNLTSSQKSLIEDEISKKGVQFLVSNSKEIRIKLTPNGIKGYNSRLYLRPPYIRIENNNIYVFDATEKQIEFYFFKFGSDAEIISPLSLRERFKCDYLDALKNYQYLE